MLLGKKLSQEGSLCPLPSEITLEGATTSPEVGGFDFGQIVASAWESCVPRDPRLRVPETERTQGCELSPQTPCTDIQGALKTAT